MSEGNEELNRRSILKSIGTGSATFAIGTGSVTATDDPEAQDIDILEVPEVQEMLDMAGNPEVTRQIKEEVGEDTSVELVTEVGTLQHVDINYESEGETEEMALKFEFDSFDEINKGQIPRKFRSVPHGVSLSLVKDENGSIVPSRTLAEFETRYSLKLINRLTDYSFGDSVDVFGVYAENSDKIFVSVTRDDELVETFGLSSTDGSLSVTNPVTRLAPPKTEIEVGYELLDSHHHCTGLATHPCTFCAGGAAGVASCAPTCAASAGATCAVCLIGFGITTHTCCVCLTCIDGFDWEDNPRLQRTCPGDLVDAALRGAHDELEDLAEKYV